MSNIAFLGLGAMGSRMAANLIKAGHSLTVWNRTPKAAEASLAAGAQWAASPFAAAKAADFVISMVRDDAASKSVWCDPERGAFAAMRPDAIAIESSTLSVDWIRELGKSAQARGIDLLEAPVSGSRPAAEAAQLVYLAGGEANVLASAEGVLKSMGAAIHHVGPIGSGTLVKLATNALLGIQVTALAELIGMLRRCGTDVVKAVQAIAETPVWSPVDNVIAGSMLRSDFQPQFPVELIEKDFGYALTAAGSDAAAPTLAAARAVFRQGIAHGLGGDNMTAVARLFDAS
ncbi:NAD(P)-dependent oxidoreductase [Propionivibrio sp.]|uniref:NAD(P)-dependent oxidoreductase n=1 Tax=Propionivibrio sp. TaxID=2212460 RepID=UPI00272E69AA|nr:NAD(P)-dependent oxidoreductase [Propionivibrio sp.]